MFGRILVVGNAATSRITLKARLAAACHDPCSVRSGAEALNLLGRWQPHLVLIAAEPSDMSGPALCAAISARAGAALPVVMMVREDQRAAALRAGAAAVLDDPADELTMLARIRSLMRERLDGAVPAPSPAVGFAEETTPFAGPLQPRAAAAALIVDQPATAVAWRSALGNRADWNLTICDAEQALVQAAAGRAAELYVIAADLARPGDGLRLLSELRARPNSRDAAFVVLLKPDRFDMAIVALDLGAGDVLPTLLPTAESAEEAALRLSGLVSRKRLADGRRLEAERERQLAWTDPLTGLANRRRALPRLAELCAPRGEGVAVVAMDIDRFKQVNDRHGHSSGDRVLEEVAHRLTSAIPDGGFVARMGGEEFLAVVPGADETAAAQLAEQLRCAVARDPVTLPAHAGGGVLNITISAGVAAHRGPPAIAVEDLLERADAALRHAKARGRDRTMVARIGVAA